jgi:NAD(P)-dependent dehydrogenase (short-subunit alcohol dehydrogenase family)
MSEKRARPSALITGASRGIGRGIASHLAAQGWALTVIARGEDKLAELDQAFTAAGAIVQTVLGDIGDEATLDAAVNTHAQAYSSMNALVLAAGVGSAGPVAGYPMRRLDRQITVNLRAPFGLLARALPLLRAGAEADPQRGGRVIALTSLAGVHPEAGLAAYGASKAALISLLAAVNNEEGVNGVSATGISPAYVDTDMSAWVSESIPSATMITVEDVVKTVELVLTVSPNAVLPHIVINRRGGGAYQA